MMKKLLLLTAFILAAFICRAQDAMTKADDWFAKKSYANASGYYNQVLTKDPDNVKALRRMGYCLLNLPNSETQAEGYFLRALYAQPNDAASNYYLGLIYIDKAKKSSGPTKRDFKAEAADYLAKADQYGNPDAKAAITNLNGI